MFHLEKSKAHPGMIKPIITYLSTGNNEIALPEFVTLEELKGVYLQLASQPKFPRLCRGAADYLQGIGLVAQYDGSFEPDFPEFGYGYSQPHSWGEDGAKNIYELLGVQFNHLLRPANQFPDGIVIISPGHSSYWRYFER